MRIEMIRKHILAQWTAEETNNSNGKLTIGPDRHNRRTISGLLAGDGDADSIRYASDRDKLGIRELIVPDSSSILGIFYTDPTSPAVDRSGDADDLLLGHPLPGWNHNCIIIYCEGDVRFETALSFDDHLRGINRHAEFHGVGPIYCGR